MELGLFLADRYEYDVRLGGAGCEQVPKEHEQYGMWQSLMMKRVDVVAWRAGVPWLIEVKPIAAFAALGQALGYGDLWEREKGPASKPMLAVCCAVCDCDLKPTFERYGVSVVSLPAELAASCVQGECPPPKGQSTVE